MLTSSLHPDATGEDAVAILSSQDFEPVPYRGRHESLGEKLGLDFSDILFAFDHIPLALTGEAHRARRASMARMLKTRQEEIAPEIPALVAHHFSALATPGRVDILEACIHPFVGEFLGRLTGAPAELDLSLVSRVFSRNLGVSQRRRMQDQLHAARAELVRLFPEDTPETTGERIALLILGRDALTGTLARSLHHTLEQARGRRLDETRPATAPTRTGVPFIDRQAIRATCPNGQPFEKGDVVRCQLHSLETGDTPDHIRFFGKGAHVCLGRAVSLLVFEALGAHLATLPVRITDLAFALRKDDVFFYPETFTAEVRHG